MPERDAIQPRHAAAPAADIPPGTLRRVEIGGRAICLAHADDGRFYAIDDECPHEFGSLSEGEIEGCEVECPLHLSRFDLATGEVRSLPAEDPVATHRVDVDDGTVYVTLRA